MPETGSEVSPNSADFSELRGEHAERFSIAVDAFPVDRQRLEDLLAIPLEQILQRVAENSSDELGDWVAEYQVSFHEQLSRVEASQTILIPSNRGIGDLIYDVLVARVLALKYPDKKFLIIKDFSAADPLFDLSEQVRVITPSQLEGNVRSEDNPVVLRVVGTQLTQDAAEIYRQLSHRINVLKQRGVWKNLRSLLANQSKDVTEPSNAIGIADADNEVRKLWAAALSQLAEKPPQLQELLDTYSEQQIVTRQALPHQLESIATQLFHFYGCSPEEIAEGLTTPILKIPEKEPAEQYDVVFVYDAFSGDKVNDKTLSADQVTKVIKGLQQRYPGLRIGVVMGRTNNQIGEQIRAENPAIGVIEAEFDQVISTCLAARVVVCPDTGITHFLNLYKKFGKQLGIDHLPYLIAIFGIDTPYSVNHYRPDMAEALLVSNTKAD